MADAEPGLRVRRPGLLDLVVDAGRRGWQRFGMPQGGPADAEAYRIATLLADGPEGGDAAAIEVTAHGPDLVAIGACRVAVASAGEVDVAVIRGGEREEPVPELTSATLRPGDVLRVGRIRGVLRAYIAVCGGIAVTPQLGSRGACLRGGTAGILARPLRRGDLLPLDPAACDPSGPETTLPRPASFDDHSPLSLCDGPQADRLSPAGARAVFAGTTPFRAAAAVDRAGIRLEGPAIQLREGHDVASQGCPAGALQLTSPGSAILLGPDRGTTGGYAIPAVVARFDLPRLGRIRPGQEVRMTRIADADRADEMSRARAAALDAQADLLRPAV